MNELAGIVDEARTLVGSGREARAMQILRDAIDATDDPELLRQIHELALDAHDHAGGFHKLEWHKLVVQSEPHVEPKPDADASA